jgi:hypothetical protein
VMPAAAWRVTDKGIADLKRKLPDPKVNRCGDRPRHTLNQPKSSGRPMISRGQGRPFYGETRHRWRRLTCLFRPRRCRRELEPYNRPDPVGCRPHVASLAPPRVLGRVDTFRRDGARTAASRTRSPAPEESA